MRPKRHPTTAMFTPLSNLSHTPNFLQHRSHVLPSFILRLFISMPITLSDIIAALQQQLLLKVFEYNQHTMCTVYLGSYWVRQAGRCGLFIYYYTSTMSKQWNYTTMHEGCHKNTTMTKWNYSVNTHEQSVSVIGIRDLLAVLVTLQSLVNKN